MTVALAGNGIGPIAAQAAWKPLAEDSGTRVCVVDGSGVLLFANERAGAFFRSPIDQLVGRAYADAYPQGIRPGVSAWTRDVFANERRGPGFVTTSRFLIWGEHWESRARVIDLGDGRRAALCVAHVHRRPTPTERILRMIEGIGDRDVALGPLAPLSDREIEVAMLIAAGMGDAEVARQLHRSTRTVHAHRRSIGKKLNVDARAEILRLMVDRGLVGLPGAAPDGGDEA